MENQIIEARNRLIQKSNEILGNFKSDNLEESLTAVEFFNNSIVEMTNLLSSSKQSAIKSQLNKDIEHFLSQKNEINFGIQLKTIDDNKISESERMEKLKSLIAEFQNLLQIATKEHEITGINTKLKILQSKMNYSRANFLIQSHNELIHYFQSNPNNTINHKKFEEIDSLIQELTNFLTEKLNIDEKLLQELKKTLESLNQQKVLSKKRNSTIKRNSLVEKANEILSRNKRSIENICETLTNFLQLIDILEQANELLEESQKHPDLFQNVSKICEQIQLNVESLSKELSTQTESKRSEIEYQRGKVMKNESEDECPPLKMTQNEYFQWLKQRFVQFEEKFSKRIESEFQDEIQILQEKIKVGKEGIIKCLIDNELNFGDTIETLLKIRSEKNLTYFDELLSKGYNRQVIEQIVKAFPDLSENIRFLKFLIKRKYCKSAHFSLKNEEQYNDQIQELYLLDFPRFEALKALKAHNGDVKNSIGLLTQNLLSQENLFSDEISMENKSCREKLFEKQYKIIKESNHSHFEGLMDEFKSKNKDKSTEMKSLIDRLWKINLLFKTFKNCYSEMFPEVPYIIDEWKINDFLRMRQRMRTIDFVQDERKFAEVLALISKAINLFKGGAFYPKDTQIIAVSIMTMSKNCGILTQVNTGEGKSLIVSMMALIRRLQGYYVDVVSSSSVLAERDADSFEGLYKFFDFSVISCKNKLDHRKEKIERYNKIFDHDIIYGDVFEFQCSLMEKFWFKESIENFNIEKRFIIVDEVDCMMIDNLQHMAQIACPTTGNDQLNLFLMMIWKKADALDLNMVEENGVTYFKVEGKIYKHNEKKEVLAKKELVLHCKAIINKNDSIFPAFLRRYIDKTYDEWCESAIKAGLMSENKDYIVSKEGEIVPVNQATGVLQEKTVWSKALHQFLQIKHYKKITPINSTHTFVSNVCYFKNYNSRINGMTGTLGSQSNISNLKEIYGLETYIIPPFKKKQFQRLVDLVCLEERWIPMILQKALTAAKEGKAVLIINDSIGEANLIKKLLDENLKTPHKVFLYTRNDEQEQVKLIEKSLESGDIVVATNLAGRGTDFHLSEEVLQNGGLFVILTFLPDNQRIEDQGLGRAARNGQLGCGLLIINGQNISNIQIDKNLLNVNPEENTEIAKKIIEMRDEQEKKRNEILKNNELPFVLYKDKMVREFSEFSDLEILKKDKDENIHLINEIEDKWGKFIEDLDLKHYKHFNENPEQLYKSFIRELKNDLINDSFVQNPYFCIDKGNQRIFMNKYSDAIESYDKAIRLCKEAISAYYNKAYAILIKKTNNSGLSKAEIEIKGAMTEIEENIVPKLALVQSLFPEVCSVDSDLTKQYKSLIKLYQNKLHFLNDTLIKIRSMSGKEFKVNSKSYLDTFKAYKKEPGFDDFLHKGFYVVFDLEEIPPEPSWWDVGWLSILAVGQFVGGCLLAVVPGCQCMAWGMIAEGIKDGCKAYRVAFKGEEFSWNQYWIDKAITYVSLALTPSSLAAWTGVDSMMGAGVDVVKTVDKKFGEKLESFYHSAQKYANIINVVNGGVKSIAKDGIKGLGKEVLKLAINQGVQKTIQEVGKFILDKTILSSIGDAIEKFIKNKFKSIIDSVFSDGKKIFQTIGCALSLSNKRNLKEKLWRINDSIKNIKIKIENKCKSAPNDVKVKLQNTLSQLIPYQEMINALQSFKFHEEFNDALKMIKNSNGSEENCLEMKKVFESSIGDSNIISSLSPMLGDLKYMNKIKVFTSVIQKICTMAASAKDLIEKIQNGNFNLDFAGLKDFKDEEINNFVGNFETIRSLLKGLMGSENNECENSLKNIYEEIAHDCRVQIINCFSEKFAKQISGKSAEKLNSLSLS